MAAFRFRLQKVLELREEGERESARGLVEAREGADQARQARDELAAAQDEGRSRLAEAHGAGSTVGHLQNMAYVVDRVGDQIEDADEVCREADEQVVDSLRSYHDAFQKRRTMEGLRDRKLGQWRSDEARNERKTMDEAALSRHGRADDKSR